MPTVNYLQVIGCEHDAAYWNESYRKGRQNGKTKFMKAYLYRHQLIKINPPKMTKSTSTDVTFGGTWHNRVVAKQEDFHSIAPADK